MIFPTTINGTPCQCCVDTYEPAHAGVLTGPGPWYPPEPAEFEFHLLDQRGLPAPNLEQHLTDRESQRLLKEFQTYLKDMEDIEPPDKYYDYDYPYA